MIATDFVAASIKALSKGDRIVLMQLLSKPMTKANQESMIKVLFTDNLKSAPRSDLKRLYRAQFSKSAPSGTKSAMKETPSPIATPTAVPAITEYFTVDSPQQQVQSIMQDVIRCLPKEHLDEVASIINMPGSKGILSILTSSVVTKIAKANPEFNGRLKALYKALTPATSPVVSARVVSAPVVSAPVASVEESEVMYYELFSMSDDEHVITDDDEDSMFSSTDMIQNAFQEEEDDLEVLMRRASARFMSAVLPDMFDRTEDCRKSIVDLGDFIDRARGSAL